MGQITEDMTFTGNTRFLLQPTFPDGGVTNAKVASNAAIAASKLQHQHRINYSQPNTTATAVTQVIYRCYGVTGVIKEVAAGSIAIAVGAATVTVDVKKNGTTVLSAVITLDSANTARVAELGTLSVTTLAAGDVLEVVTTATAAGGTIPTGLFVAITVEEDPA